MSIAVDPIKLSWYSGSKPDALKVELPVLELPVIVGRGAVQFLVDLVIGIAKGVFRSIALLPELAFKTATVISTGQSANRPATPQGNHPLEGSPCIN